MIPLPPREVVDNRDRVALLRQIECGRPPAIAVAAKHRRSSSVDPPQFREIVFIREIGAGARAGSRGASPCAPSAFRCRLPAATGPCIQSRDTVIVYRAACSASQNPRRRRPPASAERGRQLNGQQKKFLESVGGRPDRRRDAAAVRCGGSRVRTIGSGWRSSAPATAAAGCSTRSAAEGLPVPRGRRSQQGAARPVDDRRRARPSSSMSSATTAASSSGRTSTPS